MKRWWEAQSARINALSLRERVFLFLAVIACSMALIDSLWLSPAQVAHKQLTQRFEKQSSELQRTRDTLRQTATPVDSHKPLRDEISTVAAQLDTTNSQIRGLLPTAADETPLTQVLNQFLRRHEGLTLVRTTALAPEAASVGNAVATPSAAAMPAGLTRQGVELVVSGPYPQLMRYVQALETALPNVRWGSMTVKSEKSPPELTLQLFLVGVQP